MITFPIYFSFVFPFFIARPEVSREIDFRCVPYNRSVCPRTVREKKAKSVSKNRQNSWTVQCETSQVNSAYQNVCQGQE